METKTKQEIKVDVAPRGIASAVCDAPFDEAKGTLESEGYRIISLAENAKLRIQEGEDDYVSRNGNYTKEGVIYVPKKGIFLTKNSPIIADAKKATQCHRDRQEYYLNDEQIERALENSIQLEKKEIPTNRFADDEITVYAFGDEKNAEKYGQFLIEAGIKKMPIYLANIEDEAFARQMWFGSLDYRSELSGSYGCLLHHNHRVRGVCESAEGTSQKFEEAYTPKQLEKTLNKLGFSGIAEGLISNLRNQ